MLNIKKYNYDVVIPDVKFKVKMHRQRKPNFTNFYWKQHQKQLLTENNKVSISGRKIRSSLLYQTIIEEDLLKQECLYEECMNLRKGNCISDLYRQSSSMCLYSVDIPTSNAHVIHGTKKTQTSNTTCCF